MKLPAEYIQNIEGTFGEEGREFLAQLPALIEEASERWGLTDVKPASNLSYNFVAFAHRAERSEGMPFARTETKRRVVLKMSVPNREARSEIAALRLFNGEGACRLLDYDEEKCWMLLERLHPGAMLSTLEDDEEATHIAAELMQRIWRPVESASSLANTKEQAPLHQNFIQLSGWFDGLKELRPRFGGGTGPFPAKIIERVEHVLEDFFAENHMPVLMHGDFHHFNILSSERGWLVIDPKGVIGPACYEVGPLLINPWGDLMDKRNYRGITRRRIDILHERLGFERERIHEWGLAHAVLSAWWGMDEETGWEYALSFAEMIADLRIK